MEKVPTAQSSMAMPMDKVPAAQPSVAMLTDKAATVQPPAATLVAYVPMAKSSTAKSRAVENRAEARGILPSNQEYVECGRYLVPVPKLPTLGDTIKEAMRNPPAGWIYWLRKYHLWDQGMSERDTFTRFYKFHKVKFLVVPEER